MSGHSKWSTIKHKKALTDAKRAGAFTKLAKDVALAAKDGGDPEMNFKLRMAIDKAHSFNMPKNNIERAIKRGTGEDKDAAAFEEIVYEAYGPSQIAMLISCATDNKNRTLSDVKTILTKNGGKFVEGGSVSWQFENLGIIEVEAKENDENEMKIIDSGARDYKAENGSYTLFSGPTELKKVKETLESTDLKIISASLGYKAKNTIKIDENTKEKYETLLEALEENDDVIEIWDNLN